MDATTELAVDPTTACVAEEGWVTDPSRPTEGEFAFNSLCSFHQWAYKTFLWLTSQDETGGLVFESFASPSSLFTEDPPPGDYPGRAAGVRGVEMLARVAKGDVVDEETVFQAGPGNRVLVDQAERVVYYSLHLDETYWDFIKDKGLYRLDSLRAFPADSNFHVGSLELKGSWRVAAVGGQVLIEDAEQRFHTAASEIPTVTVNDDGQVVQQAQRVQATMALVGLHVTGVVTGHPEFIWATFGHVDNNPDCADVPQAGPGPATNPVTGQAWSFYDGRAPRAATNQSDVSDPLAVVNVCDVHPRGGGDPGNVQAIRELNESVRGFQESSVWANYGLEGGIWTTGAVPLNNGAFAADDSQARQLGSLELANSTMETFTQDQNCFACHNGGAHEVRVVDDSGRQESTVVNAKNINLSHFVVNYQAKLQVAGNQ